MFLTYDPVMRSVLGIQNTANPDGLRASFIEEGIHFIEVDEMIPEIDKVFVNLDEELQEKWVFPFAERLQSKKVDQPSTVPMIPDLPAGAIVEPPMGTPLLTGDNYISIRSPGYVDHDFSIFVWTKADEHARLIGVAKNARWELEQAGAPYKGLKLATDDRCKTLIASSMTVADILVKRGLPWQTNWNFLDGKMVVKRADLDEMALAIGIYVNELFARCDQVEAKIVSGKLKTDDEVIAAMQPESS